MDVPDIGNQPFTKLASILAFPLVLSNTTATRSISQTLTKFKLLTSPSFLNSWNMESFHLQERDGTIKQEYLTAVPDIDSRQRAPLETNYRH